MTILDRRRIAIAAAALAATAMLSFAAPSAQAQAQGWPNRPVRVVLPFAAGGVADITARLAAEKLSDKFGQRFIVENVPGAGGTAAARAVLSAPADGYTLALLTNGTAVSVSLFNDLKFDPLKDFVPVSTLGYFDFVLVTKADSPIKTVADIRAMAKDKPNAFNVGTINVGSTQNLTAELLKSTLGADFTIVPFRATPDLVVATLRGDVQVAVDSYAALKAGLADNQTRAIAATGAARSESLPQVPTVAEGGLAGFDVTSWNAIYVPAGTPVEIADMLNKALREILADPDLRRRYLDLGIAARASSPQELTDRMKQDIVKWSAVIEKAKIQKQ